MLTKLKMMRDSAKCLLVVIAVLLLAALGVMAMVDGPKPGGPIGVIATQNGGRIELMAEPGGCIKSARLAVWYSVDRKDRVPGCWRMQGDDALQIAFADGDADRIPLQLVQKPMSL